MAIQYCEIFDLPVETDLAAGGVEITSFGCSTWSPLLSCRTKLNLNPDMPPLAKSRACAVNNRNGSAHAHGQVSGQSEVS